MRETEIVDRIRKLAERGYRVPAIVQSIGDDCTILRPSPNHDLVFTCDFVLEDRHFTRQTHTAADIGHLALARSLSDLAAMGSEPVFCLVSLAVPDSSAVTDFYKGLLTLAQKYKIALGGGDLARFDKIVVDVMCCGRVPRGAALLRSGAKPGHRIYVTGQLGKRRIRPEPRIQAGLMLRRLQVSAAMDLSDGLSLDLRRLCAESKVGAEIDSPLPIAAGATLDEALHRGEDYELLFTAPPQKKIPRKIAALPVTPIGIVTSRHPGRVHFNGRPLEPKAFDHFA